MNAANLQNRFKFIQWPNSAHGLGLGPMPFRVRPKTIYMHMFVDYDPGHIYVHVCAVLKL